MCVMSSQLIGAARAACALVGWPGSLKEIRGGFLEKYLESGGWLLKEKEERKGAQHKSAFFFLLTNANRAGEGAHGGGLGAGSPGHGGGRGLGQNREEVVGVRFPYSPRPEVERGGLATVVGGGGRLWPWWRRCRLGEGASGGGDGCGGRELRGGPLYRPGEAVERGGRRWPSSAAINGGLASSGCRGAAAYMTTRRLRQRRAVQRASRVRGAASWWLAA